MVIHRFLALVLASVFLSATAVHAADKNVIASKQEILTALKHYRKAKDGLLIERRWSKQPRLYDNKIKIVDLKIHYLEQEYARLFREETGAGQKPLKQLPPLRIAPVPAAPPPAAAKPLPQFSVETIPAPVLAPPAPAEPAPIVTTEFIVNRAPERPAIEPVRLEPLPASPSDKQRAPAAMLPVKLEPLGYSDPITERGPASMLPQPLAPLDSADAAGRAPASMLPFSLQALTYAKPESERFPAVKLPDPPKKQEKAKAEKPKKEKKQKAAKKAEIAPAAETPAPAPDPSKPFSGEDWLKLDEAQQNRQLLTELTQAMNRGIQVWKPHDFYFDAIQEAIQKDPTLGKKTFFSLLLDQISLYEPDNRPVIQVLRGRTPN